VRLYAALTILFDRMHRVQTRSRRTPPLTIARTRWMFGSNRRGRTLWAWLTRRPTTGLLPQTSQCLAIAESRKLYRMVMGGPPGSAERVSIAGARAPQALDPATRPDPVAVPAGPRTRRQGQASNYLPRRTDGGRPGVPSGCRSVATGRQVWAGRVGRSSRLAPLRIGIALDRKSTRLNLSHVKTTYAAFRL